MSHKHGNMAKPPFRTREAFPQMAKTPKGIQIICPFCKPTHVLVPGEPAICGTVLKLTAEQQIFPSRITRMSNIKCMKCHNDGGEMVRYMTGFVHLEECDPKTRLLPAMPRFSRFAGLVFRMPKKMRSGIEKIAGVTQAVHELDQTGNKTGKILGYFFMKNRGVANG